MKKLLIIILTISLLPLTGYSQKRKKKKGTSIYVSTMFNYYPSIKPYSFEKSITRTREDVLLNFQTSNSGTFVVEQDTVSLMRINTNELPSQLLGFGASVQILQGNLFFHEISLTKLSFVKSRYNIQYIFTDAMGDEYERNVGYDQKTTSFAFRYEFGKYFGKEKAPLKFGLSASIEPSFYFYERVPTASNEFTITGKLFIVDMAIIPSISARISKKVSIDFKMIPNVLIGKYESVRERDPSLISDKQKATTPYESPELSLGFNLLLKYQIKAPKKRRRRKG